MAFPRGAAREPAAIYILQARPQRPANTQFKARRPGGRPPSCRKAGGAPEGGPHLFML